MRQSLPNSPTQSGAADSGSPVAVSAPCTEASIRQQLLNEEGLTFSSLVVRRVAEGICLEGVLEVDADSVDLAAAALRIIGDEPVRNQLLIRNSALRQCADLGAAGLPRSPR